MSDPWGDNQRRLDAQQQQRHNRSMELQDRLLKNRLPLDIPMPTGRKNNPKKTGLTNSLASSDYDHQYAAPSATKPPATKEDYEDLLANLIGLSSAGAVIYFGVQAKIVEWYWPVAIGSTGGWLLSLSLRGPLRIVVVVLRRIITGAFYTAFVALIGLILFKLFFPHVGPDIFR